MSHAGGIGSTLFGKSRLAILSLMFTHCSERYYLKQIVHLTQLGVGAVQRELAALTECGILLREPEGRQTYFRVNPACPIHDELKAMIVKTGGVADVLRERLAPLQARICAAFVYGSFSEGTEHADSDIDVMVIGAVSFAEVCAALGPVQDSLRREVNPTVYPPAEFAEKQPLPFLQSVLAKPKIFLIGEMHDLDRLAP